VKSKDDCMAFMNKQRGFGDSNLGWIEGSNTMFGMYQEYEHLREISW
jgi:hypothetical protein